MINIGTIQVTPNEDSTIISDGKHTQKERSESTMQQEPTTSGVSKDSSEKVLSTENTLPKPLDLEGEVSSNQNHGPQSLLKLSCSIYID
jgi:hypothetical protein